MAEKLKRDKEKGKKMTYRQKLDEQIQQNHELKQSGLMNPIELAFNKNDLEAYM